MEGSHFRFNDVTHSSLDMHKQNYLVPTHFKFVCICVDYSVKIIDLDSNLYSLR